MLGDLITRSLLLLLGYAYPAFECYKTVEKNRVQIQELRFWCQYWIIVALLTALERVGDALMSWFPLYSEMKLVLIIYLWYPKTKGTGYVYDTLLRPYVSKHETDIDRKLLEWRARVWDLALFYLQNCSQLGQSAFIQVLDYLASTSRMFNRSGSETANRNDSRTSQPPPNRAPNKRDGQSDKNKRWPPSPSAPPLPGSTFNRVVAEPPKTDLLQALLFSRGEYREDDDAYNPGVGPAAPPENYSNRTPHQGHLFRRSKPHN